MLRKLSALWQWACMMALVPALAACAGAPGSGEVRLVGSFSGHVDLAAGRLVIEGAGLTGQDGRRIELRGPYQSIPVDQDSRPGLSDYTDVVELVVDPQSIGTGPAACSRGSSFCGDVTVRSFFDNAELRGVFVVLTSMTPPTGNHAFGDYPGDAPGAMNRTDAYGLWDYGNIPAMGAVKRTWKFDNFDGTDFRFRGEVWGEIVPIGDPHFGPQLDCSPSMDDDGDGSYGCTDPDCSEELACNGGSEICGNGFDDDGDSSVDCDDTDCIADVACVSPPEGLHCADILALGRSRGDGVYTIDPDGEGWLAPMSAQCDMTTDGGGWTLLLNYLHRGGTNPALSVRADSLPLIGSSTLGVDESGSPYWGHAGNGLSDGLFGDGSVEIRFFGITSNHGRVVHFKTANWFCWDYFRTGSGNCGGLYADNAEYPDHTAALPDASANNWVDQGDYAMTAFPFWLWGTYHWGIQGEGHRWEVDDYPGNDSQSTLHRIWARPAEPAGSCVAGICTDPATGLQWQRLPTDIIFTWENANTHCQNLDLNGTGWRMPNISELRSLIRNCEPIETAGACGVKDVCSPCGTATACLAYSCWTDANCNPSSCANNGGPTGCYWSTELAGTCSYYWSSSELAENPYAFAWSVTFSNGLIAHDPKDTSNHIRCVR